MYVDLLDQIAADLRSVVPPTAIAPDEAQHYPTVGQVQNRKRQSNYCCVWSLFTIIVHVCFPHDLVLHDCMCLPPYCAHDLITTKKKH